MTCFFKLRRTLAATAAALAISATTAAAIEISDINIRSEAASIADNAATGYWPNLEDDLKNALVEELADISSETGVIMQVTIRELSVAERADASGDDGKLQTTVMFISGGSAAGSLEHTVVVNQSAPDGINAGRVILPRTSIEFYQALVSHYAETVAQKVRNFN